ncbi:Hsp33 family molecular chaperone HslO [Altericroceibacterium endophyticum]|uniref:Hsp33 family molecular chaperone HslO n=1 Tax=Altericroceibacterium endophyticum TaxID=1808508 RepID=A0A6I4T422_9SPHN|nr:Hsp33 family molecular chaperone HslO [Altericroceibacterium endophyticum]MXO65508.1 Hsp33 family molecular chaperone HslO [Altericroceibacterium endophyticum]
MTEQFDPKEETGFDRLLHFTLPERDARGRAVRLGPVLDRILGAHDYPAALKHVLAEALVLTALMGSLLKGEGSQLTMQAQTEDGVVDLLACDYRDGELRGYVQHDEERFAELGANPTLEALFGKGYLAITFDDATTGQRYQGIVPLEGGSLSEAVEAYFMQSEQVPTLIRTAVRAGKDGTVAGGILLQHLPEGEEGRERLHVRLDHPEWEHVAVLSGSIRHEELVDPALSMEALVWRLFHEEQEVRVEAGAGLSRGCRCSILHFEDVLSRFPAEDRKDMRDERGIILVDCAFCSREFEIQD